MRGRNIHLFLLNDFRCPTVWADTTLQTLIHLARKVTHSENVKEDLTPKAVFVLYPLGKKELCISISPEGILPARGQSDKYSRGSACRIERVNDIAKKSLISLPCRAVDEGTY